ncbi:MAG: ribonuclease HII [Bacteroidales bacterium]|nr:ribonuclease HII [Bacteroidales bacterium]
MLKIRFSKHSIEAGCDEAGRGCLAGPVYAAAVILPDNFNDDSINDSKKLSEKKRYILREIIKEKALAWAVASVDNIEIDEINILNASILAMHKAIAALNHNPQLLLIDGNRFKPYSDIPYKCIIKGDAKYRSIAAASILAKTYRDDYMAKLHENHPEYGWNENKGYPTRKHKDAIKIHGITEFHRKSFKLNEQLKLVL